MLVGGIIFGKSTPIFHNVLENMILSLAHPLVRTLVIVMPLIIGPCIADTCP